MPVLGADGTAIEMDLTPLRNPDSNDDTSRLRDFAMYAPPFFKNEILTRAGHPLSGGQSAQYLLHHAFFRFGDQLDLLVLVILCLYRIARSDRGLLQIGYCHFGQTVPAMHGQLLERKTEPEPSRLLMLHSD